MCDEKTVLTRGCGCCRAGTADAVGPGHLVSWVCRECGAVANAKGDINGWSRPSLACRVGWIGGNLASNLAALEGLRVEAAEDCAEYGYALEYCDMAVSYVAAWRKKLEDEQAARQAAHPAPADKPRESAKGGE